MEERTIDERTTSHPIGDGRTTSFHAFLGCSLDGFIAGPGGELQWLFEFDERLGDTGYNDFFTSVDTLVSSPRPSLRGPNPRWVDPW